MKTWRVGNDVVDLNEPGVLKQHENARFVARVFTEEERAAIAEARSPARFLWALWAAKEAAFKIARKRDRRAVFAHAKFAIDTRTLARLSRAQKTYSGRIHAPGFETSVRWQIAKDRIHCVAWEGAPRLLVRVAHAAVAQDLSLTRAEARSAHSPESRGLRVLARKVAAERLQISTGLTIVRPSQNGGRFGPPEIRYNGRRLAGTDLSLSHDGAWLGVAIAVS